MIPRGREDTGDNTADICCERHTKSIMSPPRGRFFAREQWQLLGRGAEVLLCCGMLTGWGGAAVVEHALSVDEALKVQYSGSHKEVQGEEKKEEKLSKLRHSIDAQKHRKI